MRNFIIEDEGSKLLELNSTIAGSTARVEASHVEQARSKTLASIENQLPRSSNSGSSKKLGVHNTAEPPIQYEVESDRSDSHEETIRKLQRALKNPSIKELTLFQFRLSKKLAVALRELLLSPAHTQPWHIELYLNNSRPEYEIDNGMDDLRIALSEANIQRLQIVDYRKYPRKENEISVLRSCFPPGATGVLKDGITTLTVSSAHFGQPYEKPIKKWLRKTSSLRYLTFVPLSEHHHVRPDVIARIFNGIQAKLKFVAAYTDIEQSYDGVSIMVESLNKQISLTDLSLGNASFSPLPLLSPKDVRTLCSALHLLLSDRGCSLKYLAFDYFTTDRKHNWAPIFHELKANKILEELVLGSIFLNDACVLALADALKVNTTLQKLHLGSMEASPSSVVALAKVLQMNKTLKELKFRHDPKSEEKLRPFLMV